MAELSPHIVDHHGQPMARAVTDTPFEGASHIHPDIARFRPANYSAQTAISLDREMLSSRIHDVARNDGWASAGVNRQVDSIIGSGWRLTADPMAEALGITPEAALELGQQFEMHWQLYANDPDAWCDAGRRRTVGGTMALALRHQLWDGEAFGVLKWLERGGPYATAMQIIDPDRLSTPPGRMESETLRDGVELGSEGEPVAYWIRAQHPGDFSVGAANAYRWERTPREKAWGRRVIIHHFEDARAGQVRGISPVAIIVKKLKMLGKYDEAELQAAVLNAMLAAYVESPLDHEQLADMIDDTGGKLDNYQASRVNYWRDAPPLAIPGVKLNFLFPGEKINLSPGNRPNPGFEMFQRAALRNIASALGVSYEQLSMDWSQVNYSSARAALLEVWKGLTARSGFFGHGVLLPWYAAFLEEIIETGKVKLPQGAPDFRQAKAAYCNARWIGPGRGWVDPLKEAEAALARISGGLSTLEKECAEQGVDWRDVLRQQSRENKYAESLDLPLVHDRSSPPAPRRAENDENDDERDPPEEKPNKGASARIANMWGRTIGRMMAARETA